MQIRENLSGTFSLLRMTSTIGMPCKLLFCSIQSSRASNASCLRKPAATDFSLCSTGRTASTCSRRPSLIRHGRPASTRVAGQSPSRKQRQVQMARWWSPVQMGRQTGQFYVNARRIFSVYYNTVTGKAEGWGGRDRILWANSTLRALDYRTGKVVWNHELGEGESIAGILT